MPLGFQDGEWESRCRCTHDITTLWVRAQCATIIEQTYRMLYNFTRGPGFWPARTPWRLPAHPLLLPEEKTLCLPTANEDVTDSAQGINI